MQYRVGQRIDGVINNITDLGIFVTLPGHRSGLVHHNDFSGNWLRERQRYTVGQRIRVVIQHLRKGKLDLSISRVNDPDLRDPFNQFTDVSPEEFEKTLFKVDGNAQKTIKQLEKQLIRY